MFNCTQCYRSSFSALIYPCLYCGYFDPRTTVSDNFNPPGQEASSQFGAASGSKSNLLPNNMQMDELARTLYRTRNVSKHGIELDNSSTNKRSRNDICAISSQALSTCNEQRAMDYVIAKETRSTSQIAFERSTLDSIHNKFRNNKQLHLHYQYMLEFGDLENSIQQNSASNFDNFQILQNLNLKKEISDFVTPMREMIPNVDNSFAVPGPSGSHENENTSNLWVKELLSIPSIELETAGVAEKNRGEKKCNLQQHTDTIHSPGILRCNICEELIWEKEDHDIENTCDFCNEKFQCKSLLEKHSLDHEGHYLLHCRVCETEILGHIDPINITLYKCCDCDYRVHGKSNLQDHLYTHKGLKLLCFDLCDRRFLHKRGMSNHLNSHFKCEICGERFHRFKHLDSHWSEKHQTRVDSSIYVG